MSKPEIVAAIIAITQVFKNYGVPTKFLPFIAIALGALFGYSQKQNSQGIIDGVILGAMATGGYAVVKDTGEEMISQAKKKPALPIETLEHDQDRGV